MKTKNYDCSCYAEYPNKAHLNKNGTWKCVDRYEKVEDWQPKSIYGCKTHCRKRCSMEFEVKRKVKKEVEETYTVELEKYWVIRVIQGVNSKTCIKEIEYNYEPSEQEIADALVDYANKKVFATVNQNYRLRDKEV